MNSPWIGLAVVSALLALVRMTFLLERLVNAVDRNTLVQIQARELARTRLRLEHPAIDLRPEQFEDQR